MMLVIMTMMMIGGNMETWGWWSSCKGSHKLKWCHQNGTIGDDNYDKVDDDYDDDDSDDDDASNQLKWCNENTGTRATGRGQEIGQQRKDDGTTAADGDVGFIISDTDADADAVCMLRFLWQRT